MNNSTEKGNPKTLIPVLGFLILYLGCGIIFEYVLDISMGFYNIPIVVIFLIAIMVACFQNRVYWIHSHVYFRVYFLIIYIMIIWE